MVITTERRPISFVESKQESRNKINPDLDELNQILSAIAVDRSLPSMIQLTDEDRRNPNTAENLRKMRSYLTFELLFANPARAIEINNLRNRLDALALSIFAINLPKLITDDQSHNHTEAEY